MCALRRRACKGIFDSFLVHWALRRDALVARMKELFFDSRAAYIEGVELPGLFPSRGHLMHMQRHGWPCMMHCDNGPDRSLSHDARDRNQGHHIGTAVNPARTNYAGFGGAIG